MKTVSLLYHDVVASGHFDSSGFPGADSNIYKLDAAEFRLHLDALAREDVRVLLTFDDGGVSSYDVIAPALEARGLQGYFFIATNWIGKPGFLNAGHIRELRRRGHRIGTHSCSHPPRFSHCTFDRMVDEWTRSSIELSEILGESIQMGSVPGGYYSRRVAEAAARAGLRTLFTSEPTINARSIDGCVVAGRFTIRRGVSPAVAAALARGSAWHCFRQSAFWNSKKLLKAAGGETWLVLRKRILEISSITQ